MIFPVEGMDIGQFIAIYFPATYIYDLIPIIMVLLEKLSHGVD